MKACKPVPVSKGAFAFCRYSLAVLLWIAVIWQLKSLVILTAVILLLSALLTVRRTCTRGIMSAGRRWVACSSGFCSAGTDRRLVG